MNGLENAYRILKLGLNPNLNSASNGLYVEGWTGIFSDLFFIFALIKGFDSISSKILKKTIPVNPENGKCMIFG